MLSLSSLFIRGSTRFLKIPNVPKFQKLRLNCVSHTLTSKLPIKADIMDIGPIPESRFQETILFLRENFPDEPLNLGVRLCEKNVPCELLESHDLNTLKDGLSLMATDPDTGEIAGIALNGISRRGDVEEALESMRNVENIKYHHIFGLLFNLNKEADLFNKFGIDKIFELRILCVSPKYRGRGIASKLFVAAEKIAVERGFKLIKVDATSYFTQKVCETNGLHSVNEINYKEFKDENGKHIYGKVESPHDYYKIMIKQLNTKMN